MSKTGIIIQVRSGSSRLPNKVLLPFYKKKNILQIILKNLKSLQSIVPIVLATTNNPDDDAIEELGHLEDIKVFRGNENDVLLRFIGAAKKYNIEKIIRICADNPLLLHEHVATLLHEINNSSQDYISFTIENNLPVIKSHIGLFTEATTLSVLEKINSLTKDSFYHEHVTNYIYENPKLFKVKLIELPKPFNKRTDLRLTIDTKEDFQLMQNLYLYFVQNNNDINKLIKHIDSSPEILSEMKRQIIKNSK